MLMEYNAVHVAQSVPLYGSNMTLLPLTSNIEKEVKQHGKRNGKVV